MTRTPSSVSYTHLDVYKRQVLIAGALVVVLLLALAIKAMTADTAAAEELEITATCGPVTLLTAEPDVWDGEGEDPREAEKIEKALLLSLIHI